MEKGVEVSLIGLCKEFFGMKQGQVLMEFRDEFKQLTDKDKDDLRKEFTKMGYVVKE